MKENKPKRSQVLFIKKSMLSFYVVTVVDHRGNVVKVDKEETIKKKISH